ncbi:MAG: hypothetical protein KME35_10380 [Aphanocapsa sp. GSE-SYN-MK-11-07L]|jgi:type IV secretory pathway TrbL component|nr:hypothetical protein [Aphanocapsa sp. GSE-SYN-MK-11-07L]
MPGCHLSVNATAFAIVIHLLMRFNHDISLPKWLVRFSLGGLLALLMLLLPWIQKESVLAFAVGHLAIGVLILNLAILLTLAHLPGKVVTLSSVRSDQAGTLLLV